ncbi:hypothetical protein [Streptomyces sviceus]|uniref:hypothetical protein n=1 Tax=Streptomyces sviceus TaxID=285530 RepID=UPI00331E30B3
MATLGTIPEVVRGLKLSQHAERFAVLVLRHLVALHIELGEERGVKDGPHDLIALPVGAGRLSHQVQCQIEDLSARFVFLFRLVQLPPDRGSLRAETVDTGTQLLLGPALLGRQVKEVVLLTVDGVKPLG